ncbi:DUF2059 domain-containing protein [Croceibacterium sp. TMG7-5b_MA50]|uniref:DUF2059 domain-containing protein n=1 Tax=Croceibacterium sp. TMG7-5b_MA50 TaxID=3121290 RepID=UPI003221D7DB
MLRRLLPTLSVAVLLATAPAAAQEAAPGANAVSAMQAMFAAEPLTAEQEARLPAAQGVAAQVVPDGVYAEVLDTTLRTMMGPMVDLIAGGGMDAMTLAMRLGMEPESLTHLTEAERQEMTRLLDPVFAERGRLAMGAMMDPVAEMVATVEPQLRSGLARAYAVRYDPAELAALQTFFATPAGARFAGDMLLVFSDPQVMSASMEMLPKMMERMPEMMTAMSTAVETLPPERGFADLSPAERRRLAELAGTDVATLKNRMAAAPVTIPAP